jgi:hypothetical protein
MPEGVKPSFRELVHKLQMVAQPPHAIAVNLDIIGHGPLLLDQPAEPLNPLSACEGNHQK